MRRAKAAGQTRLAILLRVADGDTDREIADALNLEEGSVHTYCRRLCQETGCANRVQLARYAVARGLVPVEWTPPRNLSDPIFATKL